MFMAFSGRNQIEFARAAAMHIGRFDLQGDVIELCILWIARG